LGCLQKLTESEKQVLYLLSEEYLTPKRVAIRLKCSHQNVYKIIKNLRKKGAISKNFKSVEKSDAPSMLPRNIQQVVTNEIRLHSQEYNILILNKDIRYKERKSNLIEIDGNTIRLFRNTIEIYIGHSFYGDDANEAHNKSMKYLKRLIRRIEYDLKIILVKDRTQNIREVKAHYSEMNNELAKDMNNKKEKLMITAEEDGKNWLSIDNSFNLDEMETIHPETSKEDMDKIKPFFNDLRENKPPNLSEMMILIKEVVEVNKETSAGLNSIVQLLKPKEEKIVKDKNKPDYFG